MEVFMLVLLAHIGLFLDSNTILWSLTNINTLFIKSVIFLQVKGSEAATTTGAEAAVYASEASDTNDLLDNVLPSTITDYVALVKAHLSAGKQELYWAGFSQEE